MHRGPRLVLLGKQGSGKGTQAARLAENFGIEHLSTGELFRAAARSATALGLEAKRVMDAGELMPDDVVIGVVEHYFAENGRLQHGFVLDGFPRTEYQAHELDRVLAPESLDVVFELDVPSDIVVDRIAGRRACEQCGATYHVNLPPRNPWTCDVCGGNVVLREDDTEAAVLRRLELYESETLPLRDLYRAQGLLVSIDGTGNGDEVFKRLVAVIDDLAIA